MKKYLPFVIEGALCCFFILFVGCSSSELVNLWSDSSYQAPPLTKMLVLSASKNSVQRRIWEDAFSLELAKHGVVATPSYRLFPDAVPDTDQIIKTVKSENFDGVLVTRRLPSEMTAQYLPGYVSRETNMNYDPYRSRFITYYRDVEHAPVIDSEKVIIRIIDVWATKDDGRMIWSGTCKSPEPYSSQDVRPEIIDLVMAELTGQRIISSLK